MAEHSLIQRFEFLLPEFLREEYSPYQCRVSSNREHYDLRARKVHVQNMIKTWFNTGRNPFISPVECEECLFDTRIPNIYIGSDGLCNMCRTYKRNFDPEILAEELQTFLSMPREEGAKRDAVVAFSGGKDSTVSLYLAAKEYGLDVVAVLVSNDFIPDAVIENGRDFCNRMEVALVVRHVDLAPQVKQMMDRGFKDAYPCYVCTDMFHREIQKYCVENRINRVILGRNWWRWLEPEVRAVRRVKDEDSGLEIQFLSLPFALRLTHHSVRATLREIGWSPVEIYGNSTNCLIPGLVEYQVYKRLHYHPELNLLSREVISGYLDKEEARQRLTDIKDLTPELRRIVNEKLVSPGGRM